MFKIPHVSLQSVLCIAICFALSINTAQASTSSIIIDAENGDVLSSKGADTLRYPASLTKVMTLYITFNALKKGIITMNDELKVSRRAANMAPSRLGLRAGQKIKVETCIKALIVKSANDCASVLAENLGYTEANFAKAMTQIAKALGMKNTTFKNANGLPNRAQKTTARDMALLAAAMYHHFPQYYQLFSLKKFSYNNLTFYTHNHLLRSFDGADGMKTGFTNAAGYNIITSAHRNGKRVIAVTMGHNTAKERDQYIAKMMDKGLKRLALNDTISEHKMYAQLEEKALSQSLNSKAPQTAQDKKDTKLQLLAENSQAQWGIQVGSFSNYAKARNYALKIKKDAPKYVKKNINFANTKISVEPFAKGSAIVYRSKIVGFDKTDADKTCHSLQKENKSCIVVAMKNDYNLLLANSLY